MLTELKKSIKARFQMKTVTWFHVLWNRYFFFILAYWNAITVNTLPITPMMDKSNTIMQQKSNCVSKFVIRLWYVFDDSILCVLLFTCNYFAELVHRLQQREKLRKTRLSSFITAHRQDNHHLHRKSCRLSKGNKQRRSL